MKSTTALSIILMWVAGHCSTYGREQADCLARSTAELVNVLRIPWDLRSCFSRGKINLDTHNKIEKRHCRMVHLPRNRREETVLEDLE